MTRRIIVLLLLFTPLACARANTAVVSGVPEAEATKVVQSTPTAVVEEPSPTEPAPQVQETVAPLEPTPEPTPTPVFITEEELENGEVWLEIPALEFLEPLEVAEVTGDGESFTKKDNPAWIPQWTRFVGQDGVALIYGERQWGPVPKVFTALDKLSPGDQIIVRSETEVFHFRVIESVVIDPEEIWSSFQAFDEKAREEGASKLALLTCTPWGTNFQRLVVLAELIGEEEEQQVFLGKIPTP